MMENFVVSARKYRPLEFEDVIGQESVTTTLKNAIKSQQLAHSFLFCGPRGVGKTTCARILAREVNGFEKSESGDASNSLNIYELDAASNNSVEDIRNLIDQVRVPPQYGKYKVYIIDEVHMLSQQAFNAFLKTLEEPPPYAIFILATTEKHKILPTILSRCQIFDFSRITTDDIVKRLQYICEKESIDADENALHIIALKADGALRDALSMFDRLVSYSDNKLSYETVLSNLNILDYDYYFKMVDHLLAQDRSSVLLLFDEIIRNGFEGSDFIAGLSAHFRNLMVCKDQRTIGLLEVSGTLKERYLNQAELIPASYLLNALNLANMCEVSYKASSDKRLHVELTLMKMCHLPSKVKLSEAELSEAEPKKKSYNPEPALKNGSKEQNGHTVNREKEEKSPEPTKDTPKVEEPEEATVAVEDEAKSEPEQKKKNDYPVGLKKKLHLSDVTGNVKLSDIYSEKEDDTPGQETIQEEQNGPIETDIDKAAFDKAWHSYLDKLEAENRMSLHHVMSIIEPTLNKGEILLTLENKLQKELFINEKTKLLNYLEEALKIKGLCLIAKVDKKKAAPQKRKPFTASEKFKKMAESNPAILTLKEKFDLRLEH